MAERYSQTLLQTEQRRDRPIKKHRQGEIQTGIESGTEILSRVADT